VTLLKLKVTKPSKTSGETCILLAKSEGSTALFLKIIHGMFSV
jgi:hypothetical protein